jgi:hypothetical protein
MARSSNQIDNRLASLALAIIDLRAHFEAQLRTVGRAEEALVKCGTAIDLGAFHAGVAALRGEVEVLSDENRSVQTVIDQMNVDAGELTRSAQN